MNFLAAMSLFSSLLTVYSFSKYIFIVVVSREGKILPNYLSLLLELWCQT